MRLHSVPQRSVEWFALRSGKLTGSTAKDMLASIKTGEAAARRDLRYRLVAERLSQSSQEDSYINAVMQWGIDHESEAIAAYEVATGNVVRSVGFCELEHIAAGTSPDGFIGDAGLLSVKCPKTANHLRYIRESAEPSEHIAQNSHELWITDRQWIDFVSFDPRLPEELQLFIFRVQRDEARIENYGHKAISFLAEVDREVEAISTMCNLKGQLTAAGAR